MRYRLEPQLAEVFGATVAPSPGSADALYDHVAERLAQDAYRPRALFERFGASVLATTHSHLGTGTAPLEPAEEVDPSLAAWVEEHVTTVTTVVDRITPRTTDDDVAALASSGVLGHRDVAPAVEDLACRGWLERWWDTAAAHLTLPEEEVAAYREALLQRFANPRVRHRLEQIGADGSQKLPVRLLPALRRERGAGRPPEAASVVLAAWVLTLRGEGVPVADVRSEGLLGLSSGDLTTAVPRSLAALDPSLADDDALVAAVLDAPHHLRGPVR